MSHHFDTKLAKEDPSLNICDVYLFEGADPGTTVMAMTVNPDATLAGPGTLHPEGLYAFRFDLNGDAREEVTFKLRFGAVAHAPGDAHRHVQPLTLRRATGDDARSGLGGELLLEGATATTTQRSRVRVFAGSAPDLFAGDAAALHAFLAAFYQERRFNAEAFNHRQNFFANHNVTAIVVEAPNELIGAGTVRAWATISLAGHAPETQVSRWGIPLLTHLFLNDPSQPAAREAFNTSIPAADVEAFRGPLAEFVRQMAGYAGTADAAAHAQSLVARLCPALLPYELGSTAAFTVERFNGRPLTADAMDVMLTLAANRALGDGVAPDPTRTRRDFPYFGTPYAPVNRA